jgi:hypothetical protein
VFAAVQGLERVARLFTALEFDAKTIGYLTQHKAALGIANLRSLTLTHLRALTQYRALAKLREGVKPKVQAALDAFVAAGSKIPPGADRIRLADIWQVDVSLLDSVVVAVPLPPVAVDAVARIGEVLATLRLLGVNAFSLQKLGDDRDFAARAVQVRLDHLEHEPRGDGRVERVAAVLQHRHPGRRGEPVRRGHHAERAREFRPGRESGNVGHDPILSSDLSWAGWRTGVQGTTP